MENNETALKPKNGIILAIKANIRSYVMVIALAALWLIFSLLTDGVYTTPRNISNLFRQMATTGVIAIGMAICIITGYFDLSIGSVVGATGAMAAVALQSWGMSPLVAIILALALGLVIGTWQGFWVAYRRVPAFIVTLGGQLIFRGVVLWLTSSNTIPVNNSVFIFIGQGYVPKIIGYILAAACLIVYVVSDIIKRRERLWYGFEISSASIAVAKYIFMSVLIGAFILIMNIYEGIPIALIILIALVLLFTFVLNKTRFGRYVYAVGGNSQASKLSGINNERTAMTVFIILALTGAISGIILTGRLAAAMPASGTGMELDAIAACVIGGISLAGGKGNIWGAIVGALVISSISNGMSLLSLQTFIQNMINGLVLILAVWFDIMSSKKVN